MESLVRVIGPAPSELSFNDLLEKVAFERARVRRNLLWFQQHGAQVKPKKAKAKKAKKTKLATAAKKAGLSPEDIARAIAQLKKEKQDAQ